MENVRCTTCGGVFFGVYNRTVDSYCKCPKEKVFTKSEVLKMLSDARIKKSDSANLENEYKAGYTDAINNLIDIIREK